MNAPRDTENSAAKHRKLAILAAELAQLRAAYDVLMNAFKFEEARALHGRIEMAEREHHELAATLPPQTPSAETPTPYRVAGRRRRR